MPNSAPPDLASQFPARIYYQLVHTLRRTLPAPLTDSAEDLARRDHAAIARIAALAPLDPVEADLAALYVAAAEQWKECLRLAVQPETSPEWAMKCRAQAIAMIRQSQGALRALLRMQAARPGAGVDSSVANRTAWIEQCCRLPSGSDPSVNLVQPAPSPEVAPATIAEPPPRPQPQPEPARKPPPAPARLRREAGQALPSDDDALQALRTATALSSAFTTLQRQFADIHAT